MTNRARWRSGSHSSTERQKKTRRQVNRMPQIDQNADKTECDDLASTGEGLFGLGEMIMHHWGAPSDVDRPFIGLRPFEYSDREHFFGRDGEVDVLELQVKQNRFVAVVGRTGCGKSSIISAGLRPRLERAANHSWRWLELRPGEAPVRELALALAGLTGEVGDLLEAWADRLELVLTRSSFGLGEAFASLPVLGKSECSRVLLFVDQFEEIFKFANRRAKGRLDLATAAERRDEAAQFVRLLLTATSSPRLQLDIIVSIRSEFVGECARFHGLPEAVSRAQFLVPDMTRDQREDVIRKSVQLAGGQIDLGLVQRALNDTNDDADINIQHALMSYWKRALRRANKDVNGRSVT
jgi:hypothetical protein